MDEFERVHVELDWYDGPRQGLADVAGVPHYFQTVNGYLPPDDEFLVWPATEEALAWEREQWRLFVDWNTRFEAGTAAPGSHPGRGGIDARHDQLTELLAPFRAVPARTRRLVAEWRGDDSGVHYRPEGVGYRVRWHPAG